jgi:spore coat polysaccharide biosynthesis protein SpsF
MVHIVGIIQARMGSSRLPGKVLLDIAGQPMLVYVVERARRAETVAEVVVATTQDPADDPIEALCHEKGYSCFRGSTFDVLDRYYQAARFSRAEIIVRVTADCPVIDPQVIDETVYALLGEKRVPDDLYLVRYDFAANRLPPPWSRTYPIGLDTEVCTFPALERAWKEAEESFHREHVMPYLYDHSPVVDSRLTSAPDFQSPAPDPAGFRVLQLHHTPDYGSLRWTVDTLEDLHLMREIFARFHGRNDFSWLDVLELFQREPELASINLNVRHKSVRETDHRVDKPDHLGD